MVKRKLKPKFNEEQLGVNIFASIEKLKIPVNVSATETTNSIGEIVEIDREFEKTPYCKVFSDPSSRLAVSELSKQAKELLMWVMYELDPAKDYFWLNRQRFMLECKISSPTTVVTALKELNKKQFINPTNVREIYWINPKFMYHGSRIKNFPNNLVGGKKSKTK